MNKPDLVLTHSSTKIAWICIGFILALTGLGFAQSWMQNGELCYALDDSFIMMAISKHLAFNHVWGLTKYEFSSTASSPLFTVLLSGFMLAFGDHVWLPLAINILSYIGLTLWLAKLGQSWAMKSWQIWFLVFGFAIMAPVPILMFGSMEHITHTWIALFCLQQVIENQNKTSIWLLILFGALLSGIRYEGLFEGGLIVLWLWRQKEWTKGFAFGFGMMIPVFALGLYSMNQGWFFLPNSLVLKAYHMDMKETGGLGAYLYSWVMKAAKHPNSAVAIFALFLVMQEKKPDANKNNIWIGFILFMSLLHFAFARYGHVFRYECYLMGMSWVVIWKWVCQDTPFQSIGQLRTLFVRKFSVTILAFFILLPIVGRSIFSYAVGPRAVVNIFQQQVQTARFVKEYYDKSIVGALDVGAIAYYSDVHLVDLFGLGDIDFAKVKMAGNYKPDAIDSLSKKKKVELQIIYGEFMEDSKWVASSTWVIPHNVVCARDSVHFVALNDSSRVQLLRNLKAFQTKLPKPVTVLYWN